MKLLQAAADIYVPEEGLTPEAALARTTHLCIAAHQDDIEIMAYSGISECRASPHRWFSGVVLTDGAGSPRTGPFSHLTDEEMRDVRRLEQREAARLGGYSVQLQLAYPSAAVKTPGHVGLQIDLATILAQTQPEVVFLHQPADKHDTHVGAFLQALAALRKLPPDKQPKQVWGCEVWRGLDWLLDEDKHALDCSRDPATAEALVRVFASQIAGGKRYDGAAIGRRHANATFHTSHAVDESRAITWALDLSPLLVDPSLDVNAFTLRFVERLRADIASRLARFS